MLHLNPSSRKAYSSSSYELRFLSVMFLRKRKKLPLSLSRTHIPQDDRSDRRNRLPQREDIAPESNIAAVFHIPESLVDTADHIAHEQKLPLLTLLIDEAVQHVADRMEASTVSQIGPEHIPGFGILHRWN